MNMLKTDKDGNLTGIVWEEYKPKCKPEPREKEYKSQCDQLETESYEEYAERLRRGLEAYSGYPIPRWEHDRSFPKPILSSKCSPTLPENSKDLVRQNIFSRLKIAFRFLFHGW